MPEIEKDYQDLYLDGRFDLLNQKLDTLIGYQKSYAKDAVDLRARIAVVERLQLTCPIQIVKDDLKQHKEDTKKELKDLWDDTEDLRYYKNKPKQVRMLLYGFIFMALITLIPVIGKIITRFNK